MTKTLQITILGCGSSGGVPRVGGEWGVCDPNEPKNRRLRCSILVEQWLGSDKPSYKNRTSILIDTSPDLREQLLKSETKRLDAIFLTHDHADQTHGIDDVRAIAYRMRQKIPTYMDEYTHKHVFERFKYCFEMPDGRVHPPILDVMPLFNHNDKITVKGPGGTINLQALKLSHGPTPSFGFKINDKISYTPDVWDMTNDVFQVMQKQEVWILDALRYNPHPTHCHADKTLQWIARTRTRKAILTNLHIDMDYNSLARELSGLHEPAYDQMEIRIGL